MNQKGFSQVILLGIIAVLILVGAGGFLLVSNKNISELSSTLQLDNLCSGKDECVNFCLNNRDRCEIYCHGRRDDLCKIIFPPDEEYKKPPSFELQPNPSVEEKKNVATDSIVAEKGIIVPKLEEPPTRKDCAGTGSVVFTSPPMRLNEIREIVPMGLLNGPHVTPTDHGYYHSVSVDRSNPDDPSTYKDILAPADGIIADINVMPGKQNDYRMTLNYTCTFYTIYIHLKELSQKVLQVTGGVKGFMPTSIPVKAGEVIGRAQGFDFSVHNDEVVLKGFVIPEHYEGESWKIHTVDMFDSFVEPIKSELLSKNIRQAYPRGGKIDYDIDGKLVGNWFVEGTNGYSGNTEGDYWLAHLAFAYDALDPSLAVVSIGDFSGTPKQFAIKGNAPDPAVVSVASGLVKYELTGIEYLDEYRHIWNRNEFVKISKAIESGPIIDGVERVNGVALVQMLGERKLKFEVFPGKTAPEVAGFTNLAKTYER